LGSKADLIYTTESCSLHAPEALEALVVDFQEISKRITKNVMLSPYSSPGYQRSLAQVKSCQGKYRNWQPTDAVSRSFLLGHAVYEQLFCGFGQDQMELELEETFAPHAPLALRLPDVSSQLLGVWGGWQEWYQNSMIMPPELWKIYRSQVGQRQEKDLMP
jgi:hypothetical protein